jgi:hypothetical protein
MSDRLVYSHIIGSLKPLFLGKRIPVVVNVLQSGAL